MTRTDYDFIAGLICQSNEAAQPKHGCALTSVQRSNLSLAVQIAEYAEQQNPHFNRPRFMLGCGFAHNALERAA